MAHLDDYRWLVSDEGGDAIHMAAELLQRGELAAAAGRLRKRYSTVQTHLTLSQIELRRRALAKFAGAEQMFFNNVALQQATGEHIAAYKAAHFRPEAHVVDLCCGIGGDLLSLARRGPATGIDRDEIAALLASANCRALGVDDAAVQCSDVSKMDLSPSTLVHVDPDRRPQGKRTTQVSLHEPSEAFLTKLMESCAGGGIKLSPAAKFPPHWNEACELEWISHDGECKQLVVWFGSVAGSKARRLATMLTGDGTAHSFVVDAAAHESVDTKIRPASKIGNFLYEPDPAVIAARLVGALAHRHALSPTAAGVAYLTGDARVAEPALAAFEVVDVLPFDLKKLKAALRQRRIGRLEVKKRGFDVDPAILLRQLHCRGDEQATLILTPHAGRSVAIVSRRCKPTV